MLQWMGGSRRKVATSRRSTHKRQKHYFEQRKRQRQQQQPAALQSYADGKCSCTPHCENNRSLDILSLVNVSTVAQEPKTSNFDARDNSNEDDFALNPQYTYPKDSSYKDNFSSNHQNTHPPTIPYSEGIPEVQYEANEERTPLSFGTEAEYSKKVSVRIPDHSEDLVGKGNKLDPFKLCTTHEISVIDLLGDGGANNNVEENLVPAQEAHVAFSVEGLGEVATKTPAHSPKIFRRSFPNGSSPPREAKRQPIASKHFYYDFDDLGPPMDAMMQDIDFSTHDSSIKQHFCTREAMSIMGDQNQGFLNFKSLSPFNWSGDTSCGAFCHDDLICNIQDSGKSSWNGLSFLDDNIGDLGEHEFFCKKWADPRNVGYDDHYHNKDLWKEDFLEGWNVQKNRPSAKRAENFEMRESPFPCPKHQILEDLPNVIISDQRRHPAVGIDNDVNDAVNCIVREEAKESLSLLSEESCSSTAVRGETRKS